MRAGGELTLRGPARHPAQEVRRIDRLAVRGAVASRLAAHVEPAEQLFVLVEPVRLGDGLAPRVMAGAPDDAPAGLVEEQAQRVCDAGGDRLLLPPRNLAALAI